MKRWLYSRLLGLPVAQLSSDPCPVYLNPSIEHEIVLDAVYQLFMSLYKALFYKQVTRPEVLTAS